MVSWFQLILCTNMYSKSIISPFSFQGCNGLGPSCLSLKVHAQDHYYNSYFVTSLYVLCGPPAIIRILYCHKAMIVALEMENCNTLLVLCFEGQQAPRGGMYVSRGALPYVDIRHVPVNRPTFFTRLYTQ